MTEKLYYIGDQGPFYYDDSADTSEHMPRFVDITTAVADIGYVEPGTNTLSAATAAASDGDVIRLTAGEYVQTATISIVGKSLSIIGAGPEVSIIKCTGTDGIDVDTSSMVKHVTLKDFTICTTDAGTYTAIALEGDAVASNTNKQFRVENVSVRPFNLAADYWLVGILLIDAWDTTITGCHIRGKDNDLSMTHGIRLLGASINIFINQTVMAFSNDGLGIAGTAEGVFVTDCIFIYNTWGIYWAPATGESLLSAKGNHFDTFSGAIYTDNVHWSVISNNMILRRAGSDWVGIHCLNAAQITVTGNTILASLTGNAENGIVFNTITYGSITGNSIRGCETDIWLTAGSNYNYVVGNSGDGATNRILDSGTGNELYDAAATSLWTDNGTDISVTNGENIHLHTNDQQLLINETVTNTALGGALRVITEESMASGGGFTYNTVLINTSGGTGHREALHVAQNSSANSGTSQIVGIIGIGHLTGGAGYIYGMNPYAWADAAVTSGAHVVGMEVDTDVRATDGVTVKVGLQVIDVATSTKAGSSQDRGIWVGKQAGGRGYTDGIYIDAAITNAINIGSGTNSIYFNTANTIMNLASGDYFWRIGGVNKMSLVDAGHLTITGTYAGPADGSGALIQDRNGQAINFKFDVGTPNHLHVFLGSTDQGYINFDG